GVQRDPALAVPLTPTHLGAAQATLRLDANPFRSRLHGGGHGPLHGPTEGDAILELVGDTPGEQGRIQIGILDFVDVELHGPAGEVLETGAEPLGFRSPATDDDSRTGGVDVDDQPV